MRPLKGAMPSHAVYKNNKVVYRGKLKSCENWVKLIVMTNPNFKSVDRYENIIEAITLDGVELNYEVKRV